MDSKIQDCTNQTGEERTASALRTRIAIRDRKKALIKVCNSIISLLQELSGQESVTCNQRMTDNISASKVCDSLLIIHNDLLLHLQRMQLSSIQQGTGTGNGTGTGTGTDSDIIGNQAANSSPIRRTSHSDNIDNRTGARTEGHLSIVTTLNTNNGNGNSKTSGTGTLKENARRRCQELIVSPLEFCRGQEGFVVQGDNLLSNFKGIDFTLASWIFLDKRPSDRHSFITGKVSHHDAWPLVVLRNDGKLDIIYGHSNDFECLVTVSFIPLHIWTHVAVVVEQKKIKLFINGVLDSHVSTKGNARAVMYPIVVGRCPQGLRTHVDHVRIGFDGLLAQYRYYTRALSPIHVRVVFDQGTYDL